MTQMMFRLPMQGMSRYSVGTCRSAVRGKTQRGKREQARCKQQPREPSSVTADGPEKSLKPSTLVSHCTHLIISHDYGFLASGEPVSSRGVHFASPALPFPLPLSFSVASAFCFSNASTCAASCAIIFSSLFSVSSGLNGGCGLHFRLLATFVRMGSRHRQRGPEQDRQHNAHRA